MNTKDIEEIVGEAAKDAGMHILYKKGAEKFPKLRLALTTFSHHHEAEVERAVKAAYEHILTELHSYNNRSNCDPEWHDGFSEAIYKVEELLAFLTPTKTDNQ